MKKSSSGPPSKTPTTRHSLLAAPITLTLACAAIALLSAPLPLRAGAWTKPKGKGLAAFTYSFYYTNQQFTNGWHLQNFSNGGSFTKNEWNLYLEYGLTDHLTLIGNFFMDALRYQNHFVENTNFGLADQELGLRYSLSKKLPQALQLTVKIPGPYNINHQPSLGNAQTDVELAYYLGTPYKIANRWGFVDAGAGFRLRTGAPADEIRLYLTAGLDITHWLQLYYLEASGIFGLGNDSPQYVGENILLTTDFSLIKVGASVVCKITDNWRLQAGPYLQPAGRATGAGGGFKAGILFDF